MEPGGVNTLGKNVQGSRPQGGSMLGTDHGVNAAGLQYCNKFAGSIHNGSLLHSKAQYTTVEYSSQLF
jgi:hypothetical protein